MKWWKQICYKQRPEIYLEKDRHLTPSLRLWDLLGLGIGMVVGTAIFTLPGIVAARHAGPAVSISFLLGALGAGLAALIYAENASVLLFAGSAFSWVSILFGELAGWLCGWALLAEYFISVSFVASGWSAYMQGFLASFNIYLPKSITSGIDLHGHFGVDIFTIAVIIGTSALLTMGLRKASRVENTLVILKVVVIIIFIAVGLTAIHPANYVPFIPQHRIGTDFGGWQGVLAGTSQLFLVYVGFDAIASSTAETVNPQKTMPRGILGTLILGTVLFVAVSLVLTGMFKYSIYSGNAEPAAFALRKTHHFFVANLLSLVAILGMISGLIGMLVASSRLIYSFSRDGFLPARLKRLDSNGTPRVALWGVTIAAAILGGVLPFDFLSNLVSAGTLIAFIVVSLAMYQLRKREGKDLPTPKFKVPGYPIVPALSAIISAIIFWKLNIGAKFLMLGWLALGLIIYFVYGIRHANK